MPWLDSNYKAFWKRQNYGDKKKKKKITDFPKVTEKGGGEQKKVEGREFVLYNVIMGVTLAV